MGEEVSNKVILFLAILVVLVVTASTWLLLNKLNAMEVTNESPQPNVVQVTEIIREGPPDAGNVALTILPPGGAE